MVHYTFNTLLVWFLLEELSTGLTSLPSPLGDPSDGQLEISFVAAEILVINDFFHSTVFISVLPLHTPKHVCQS